MRGGLLLVLQSLCSAPLLRSSFARSLDRERVLDRPHGSVRAVRRASVARRLRAPLARSAVSAEEFATSAFFAGLALSFVFRVIRAALGV